MSLAKCMLFFENVPLSLRDKMVKILFSELKRYKSYITSAKTSVGSATRLPLSEDSI